MTQPIQPNDVKVVQGHSGRGLQFVCDNCGTVNWNHLEVSAELWICRNCGRVFTHDFPRLVEEFMKQYPEEAAPPPAPPAPKPAPKAPATA